MRIGRFIVLFLLPKVVDEANCHRRQKQPWHKVEGRLFAD